MKLEYILLGVLLQRPMTGYGLKRFMDVSGRFMRDKTVMSQVYRSLTQMEDKGLVSHTVEAGQGARDLKRYHVTPEGETIFFEWLSKPHQPDESIDSYEFYTRLRFTAAFLDPTDVLNVLDGEIRACRSHIERFRFRDRTEQVNPTVAMHDAFCGMVLEWQHRRGMSKMDAHLAACIELREQIAAGNPPNYGRELLQRFDSESDPAVDLDGREVEA
ncbi:MAG: PadR family transcriptional regulator [Actinomycetales bacterium]